MKIASWNVNGLRAVARKGLFEPMLQQVSPDVLLVQETKAEQEQVPSDVQIALGYHSYFNASQTRKGYSGTAIYTKEMPIEVTYGMQKPEYDQEGRIVTVFFKNITVVNCYFPNGGQGPDRLAYKLEFYEAFLEYVEGLRKKNPVVWGGDVNTAHEEIDLARPRENKENTGFLPEERAWLDEVVAHGWVDSFRAKYPEKADMYTYWDMKTHARDRNVGWRIDYLFLSPDLMAKHVRSTIHSELLGSDHCPISIELKI